MPRALMVSKNLIGDSLYIQPALAAWSKLHPDWEIDLLTTDDHVAPLYRGMGIPGLRVVFEKSTEPYDFDFEFNVNGAFSIGEIEKLHIAEAYGKLLGVQVETRLPRYEPPDGDGEAGLILFSVFSASCTSREGKQPNKMLPWKHWLQILALMRQYGKVGVLAGPKDRADMLSLREEEYYCGKPIEMVARLLKRARILITVDNGMAHLAATQETPTVLFYPQCLGKHWILPPSKQVAFVQMDPAIFPVADAVRTVREGLRRLWV